MQHAAQYVHGVGVHGVHVILQGGAHVINDSKTNVHHATSNAHKADLQQNPYHVQQLM